MHKRNPEVLRLEVALQDFAEFAIVIHYEQMRLDLLHRSTGNFPCVSTPCALIVHDGSDESLLNQGRPAQTKLNEEIVFPDRTKPCSCQQYDATWSGLVTYNPILGMAFGHSTSKGACPVCPVHGRKEWTFR